MGDISVVPIRTSCTRSTMKTEEAATSACRPTLPTPIVHGTHPRSLPRGAVERGTAAGEDCVSGAGALKPVGGDVVNDRGLDALVLPPRKLRAS